MREGKGKIGALCMAWLLALGMAMPAIAKDAVDAVDVVDVVDVDAAPAAGGIQFGIDREEYEAQARAAMQVDPTVVAHVGAIRKATLDEPASMEEPGPDVLVFDVEGSRGKGRITARFITVSATDEALGPGVLVMADGTEHAIEGDADALAAEHAGHGHAGDYGLAQGEDIFTRQAREAAQRYPLVQQHVGTLSRFDLDLMASGEAEGADEFVFDVAGDKGSGRLSAEFITVDAGSERLGRGVLALPDGRTFAFEGEAAPVRGEGEGVPATFAPQDGVFVRQARAAMQAHPTVERYIGDLQDVVFDRNASWALAGDRYAFDLVGSKGRGRLVAEFITVDADSERLGDGELAMADGTTHALKAP